MTMNVMREVVESSEQLVDTLWTDVGDPIEMWGYSKVGIWLDAYIDDSYYMSIRAVAKLNKDDTNEYPLSIKTIDQQTIDSYQAEVRLHKTECACNRYLLIVETDGVIPYLQLQMKTDFEGDRGYVDRIEVTKVLL